MDDRSHETEIPFRHRSLPLLPQAYFGFTDTKGHAQLPLFHAQGVSRPFQLVLRHLHSPFGGVIVGDSSTERHKTALNGPVGGRVLTGIRPPLESGFGGGKYRSRIQRAGGSNYGYSLPCCCLQEGSVWTQRNMRLGKRRNDKRKAGSPLPAVLAEPRSRGSCKRGINAFYYVIPDIS